MSKMTKEEKQRIEALLRQCRRQTTECECNKRDWEECGKAMQDEEERQQKEETGQQIAPELGEASREEASTSTLKVKTSKGKSIEVVRVEAGEQVRVMSHGTVTGTRDESTISKDKSTKEGEHYETESNEAPVEFEDPMYKLMQEEEMEKEYEEMTPEQEKELVSQLTPPPKKGMSIEKCLIFITHRLM